MMQCMICGCKFDETKVEPCGCNCAFGGCNGKNVRCPNCGHDMPFPWELRKNLSNNMSAEDKTSFLEKIKKSIKIEH